MLANTIISQHTLKLFFFLSLHVKFYLEEGICNLATKLCTIRYDLDTPKAPHNSDKKESRDSSPVVSKRTFCIHDDFKKVLYPCCPVW